MLEPASRVRLAVGALGANELSRTAGAGADWGTHDWPIRGELLALVEGRGGEASAGDAGNGRANGTLEVTGDRRGGSTAGNGSVWLLTGVGTGVGSDAGLGGSTALDTVADRTGARTMPGSATRPPASPSSSGRRLRNVATGLESMPSPSTSCACGRARFNTGP